MDSLKGKFSKSADKTTMSGRAKQVHIAPSASTKRLLSSDLIFNVNPTAPKPSSLLPRSFDNHIYLRFYNTCMDPTC